jgi:hypothetical protein
LRGGGGGDRGRSLREQQPANDSQQPRNRSQQPDSISQQPLTAASSLHFPAQLLGHNKNTSQTAHALGRVLTSVFALSPSKIRNSQAAIYGDLSGPTVVVFAARWSSAAASSAASAAFDKSLAVGGAKGGGSTDAHSFPAGPHGGALECGHATRSGVQAIVCVWADKVTYGGMIYTAGSASSLSDAASKPTRPGPRSSPELASAARARSGDTVRGTARKRVTTTVLPVGWQTQPAGTRTALSRRWRRHRWQATQECTPVMCCSATVSVAMARSAPTSG